MAASENLLLERCLYLQQFNRAPSRGCFISLVLLNLRQKISFMTPGKIKLVWFSFFLLTWCSFKLDASLANSRASSSWYWAGVPILSLAAIRQRAIMSQAPSCFGSKPILVTITLHEIGARTWVLPWRVAVGWNAVGSIFLACAVFGASDWV